jgi:hypothetical protein
MTALSGWENFYVIVGSSAGALIGLQFVVITLIAEMPIVRDLKRASSAFATPTIVHFGSVLLLSALQSVPWRTMAAAAVAWVVVGLAGIVYTALVIRRMRTQTGYKPEFEDWLFHAVLPLAAYTTLAASAYLVGWTTNGAMFAIAAASLLLLFVGIHNAWDAVTYHVYVKAGKGRQDNERR